jgi:CO dehydrogenase/acetyl-CoA synthase delta subunit
LSNKEQGGTRGRSPSQSAEKFLPLSTLLSGQCHTKPVITLDVFDMEVPYKAVKMHVKDVVGDPAAWAKLAVEKIRRTWLQSI